MKTTLLAVSLCLACATMTAQAASPAQPAAATPAARAYIISPHDGATVPRTFTVRFGLSGMGVAPAGIVYKNTGHHHLLIDVATLPAAGQPIPADARHRHFGGGQSETTLTLAPGTHTLRLELGDAHHMPFNPPIVSQAITVHVE
ncbi:MAG TPA: DUF4399 domain-containing protein [Nevskiaceae bacterium]|nr:DUF4399 domain-containing protein [Nevskiaceae bacterium]